MTRVGTTTAVLAAALAFGVGYAARLAGAWAGGSIRIVEAETIDATRADRPLRRSVPTIDASPPKSDVATPRAPSADEPRGDDAPAAAADVQGKALFEVFARQNRTAEFRRMIDKVAVAPLGRAPPDLGLFDAVGAVEAPCVESVKDLRVRLSAVNAAAGGRLASTFQFAALRRGERFEVVLGEEGLATTLDPTSMARYFAARAGKAMPGPWRDGRHGQDLAPEQAEALMRSCAEAHRAKETARRDLWSRLRGLAASGAATPLDPREVVGVCVANGRCVVVRVGDDPRLDRLVDEADRLEREVRAEVEQELRP